MLEDIQWEHRLVKRHTSSRWFKSCQTYSSFLLTIFGSPPPAPFNLRYWTAKVAWYGQIEFFQTNYDKIKLQKSFMTSSQSRHRNTSLYRNRTWRNWTSIIIYDFITITSPKYVTKLRLKISPFCLPSRLIKICGYANVSVHF